MQLCSRSRAWSHAIGRSGVGCHCEKAEPPTLAAHARGALRLVGTAWGVTARKANRNASNARGVTAGKMVCVCLSSIGGQTAGPIKTKFGTHMRMDLGMVPT